MNKKEILDEQMKPESDSTLSTNNKLPGIGLPDGGCPVGTVPIRRTTKKRSY